MTMTTSAANILAPFNDPGSIGEPRVSIVPLSQAAHLIEEVSDLLNECWTRSKSARLSWLRAGAQMGNILPQSCLMLGDCGEIIGHGRLSSSYKVGGSVDTVSCIVTSILIAPKHRRQGYGRRLLTLLEDYARSLHFGRTVLWTLDQVDFYKACGYYPCRPLHRLSSAASKLDPDNLSRLEGLLQARKSPSSESVEDLKDDGDDASQSVWLSKRLVDHMQPFNMDKIQVEADVRLQYERQQLSSFHKRTFVNLDVPNEQQIGPCCGLAALRCVQRYWELQENAPDLGRLSLYSVDIMSASRPKNVTLLHAARSEGYTMDGEMFCATNLAKLAANICGLDVIIQDMTPEQLIELVHCGIPVIVAFDKAPKDVEHAVATNLGGSRAHWGIVRGVIYPPASNGKDNGSRMIVWTTPNTNRSDDIAIPRKQLDQDLYVILQHTNHTQVCVVSYKRLSESNRQLDDQPSGEDDNMGWVQTNRKLANCWIVCTSPMKRIE